MLSSCCDVEEPKRKRESENRVFVCFLVRTGVFAGAEHARIRRNKFTPIIERFGSNGPNDLLEFFYIFLPSVTSVMACFMASRR